VTTLRTGEAVASEELSPVLTAAIAAFAEHGYHGATVRDIAARAGLSVPGMYHHYASKQEMLRALVEQSMADILSRSRDALRTSPDAPVSRFSALVRTVVMFMAEHRELAVLQAESRYLEPDNWLRYVALRDEQESLVTAEVGAGRRAGDFLTTETAQDATRAVLTLCLGIPGWYRPDGPLTPKELADQYVGFCLGIVGHPPADPQPTRDSTATPRPAHRKERP
jgi:AcrR family transcriptional regulator